MTATPFFSVSRSFGTIDGRFPAEFTQQRPVSAVIVRLSRVGLFSSQPTYSLINLSSAFTQHLLSCTTCRLRNGNCRENRYTGSFRLEVLLTVCKQTRNTEEREISTKRCMCYKTNVNSGIRASDPSREYLAFLHVSIPPSFTSSVTSETRAGGC